MPVGVTEVNIPGVSANDEVYEYKKAASFGSVDPKSGIPFGLVRVPFIFDSAEDIKKGVDEDGNPVDGKGNPFPDMFELKFRVVLDEEGRPLVPDMLAMKNFLLREVSRLLFVYSEPDATEDEKVIYLASIKNALATSANTEFMHTVVSRGFAELINGGLVRPVKGFALLTAHFLRW